MQITCTAYNGGLVATHPLQTCLARIAVKEHACMRCEQAVKFMMENKSEISALKEKLGKRMKPGGVLGTDPNGNHVLGVSATDKPDIIDVSIPVCPKCNRRPQQSRMRRGKPSWSGACIECLRVMNRKAEESRKARRPWRVTLDFTQEKEFLNELKAHARANRRTLEAEMMYRLGGEPPEINVREFLENLIRIAEGMKKETVSAPEMGKRFF